MNKWRIMLIGAFLAAFVLVFFAVKSLGDARLHVYFLDIGQGDAILVRTPFHGNILIDGGPDNTVVEELSEVLPFYERRIDLLVLSHPHADHLNGLVDVLNRYEVGRILLTGASFESSVYRSFLYLLAERGVPVSFALAAHDFRLGPVVLDVVYPVKSFQGMGFENLNNSSIALRVLYGETAVYLSGDLEVEGEDKLAASGQNLRADVFKAGHHGSRTSSSESILEQVEAEYAVISCGVDNKFKHPHAETLEKFRDFDMTVFRTDLNRRVEMVSNGEEVWMESER